MTKLEVWGYGDGYGNRYVAFMKRTYFIKLILIIDKEHPSYKWVSDRTGVTHNQQEIDLANLYVPRLVVINKDGEFVKTVL